MNESYIDDKKAQTSLEVILIVAGVLVLVTLIGYYIKTKVVESQPDENKWKELYEKTSGK
ncbi:MAG: hypothetical protein COT14_01935 [Candidatus Diapherotrites archaeon CG08_land_8_20_14_0_20_30_16]|nr:MAG: hypothetical protein COT14_01935 [Candidatus Diapherotrites archaeon CG08_land_8_20_14_0_20_30_16]